MIVLDEHDHVEAAEDAGARAARGARTVPGAGYVLAAQVRAGELARPGQGAQRLARTLHASLLDDSAPGRVSVIVEPSRRAELAEVSCWPTG